MTYNPNYDGEAIEHASERVNISGMSPRDNITIEEENQRRVAESKTWLLARKVNYDKGEYVRDGDSRASLEALGFVVSPSLDGLFFEVVPPEGWTKETSGHWTTVKDKDGRERITEFFKGAWYDTDAFLNFNSDNEAQSSS